MVENHINAPVDTTPIQKQLTIKEVEKVMHLPLLEASVTLSVEMQELRQICRQNGYSKWPYSYRKKDNLNKTQCNAFSNFSTKPNPVKQRLIPTLNHTIVIHTPIRDVDYLKKIGIANLIN